MTTPGEAPRRVAPAPGPADVGLVAATSIEVDALLRQFTKVRKYQGPRHRVVEGECGGKLVAVTVAGMGRRAARRGTQLLLDGHRPQWIVSAGYGGALDPDLKRNDVVLPNEVINEAGARYTIDVTLPPGAPDRRFGTGRLLTVDRMVMTAAEKAGLRERFGADVVDMETSEVAAVCHERGVRFLALRVVSDEAGVDLPREVLAIVGPSGSYRVGAAVGAIWKRPSSLKDLWALREHAVEAADRLAEVMPAVFERLS